MTDKKHDCINSIVKSTVETFAKEFKTRHKKEKENPQGAINRKLNNIFVKELNKDIIYYTALVRSFDSSLGNMLEKLAIKIATLSYTVSQKVEGKLYQKQSQKIAGLLESYKNRTNKPQTKDYQELRQLNRGSSPSSKRHESDYYLKDETSGIHYLIELKIGGDLDNKKARSEKEALLEQFSILSNNINSNEFIEIKFATAYNKDGEGNIWKQERVQQFFSEEELLIGKNFWNFITKMPNGYEVILEAYRRNCKHINNSLIHLKKLYLG